MQTDPTLPVSVEAVRELPEEIEAAIQAVVLTQQAFWTVQGPDKARAAIKASFACRGALEALTTAILSRLTAAETARDAALAERDTLKAEIRETAMKQLASDCGWELENDKLRAERDAALARVDRLENALREIARQDRGGLQGLDEDGCSEDDAVAHLISQIERRRSMARSALSPAAEEAKP